MKITTRICIALWLNFAVGPAAFAAGANQAKPASGSGDQSVPDMFKGTPEEQAACSLDAAKFCSDAIPDTFKVLACLKEHRDKLKKTCEQVLEKHGQ
jgi:Cysteine rich repeat